MPAWLAREPRGRTGLRTLSAPDVGVRWSREGNRRHCSRPSRHVATSHQARLVLLVGEPGIGKSRLVLEFARDARSACRARHVAPGCCTAYGDGYGSAALADILKAHAGILDSDDVATVETKLGAVFARERGTCLAPPAPASLLGLGVAEASREESLRRVDRVPAGPCLCEPAVVVLEDLHWSGEGMPAFLDYVAARELAVPLLIVATTRPELLVDRPDVLVPAGSVSRLALTPLTRRRVGQLVGALLDGRVASQCAPPSSTAPEATALR